MNPGAGTTTNHARQDPHREDATSFHNMTQDDACEITWNEKRNKDLSKINNSPFSTRTPAMLLATPYAASSASTTASSAGDGGGDDPAATTMTHIQDRRPRRSSLMEVSRSLQPMTMGAAASSASATAAATTTASGFKRPAPCDGFTTTSATLASNKKNSEEEVHGIFQRVQQDKAANNNNNNNFEEEEETRRQGSSSSNCSSQTAASLSAESTTASAAAWPPTLDAENVYHQRPRKNRRRHHARQRDASKRPLRRRSADDATSSSAGAGAAPSRAAVVANAPPPSTTAAAALQQAGADDDDFKDLLEQVSTPSPPMASAVARKNASDHQDTVTTAAIDTVDALHRTPPPRGGSVALPRPNTAPQPASRIPTPDSDAAYGTMDLSMADLSHLDSIMMVQQQATTLQQQQPTSSLSQSLLPHPTDHTTTQQTMTTLQQQKKPEPRSNTLKTNNPYYRPTIACKKQIAPPSRLTKNNNTSLPTPVLGHQNNPKKVVEQPQPQKQQMPTRTQQQQQPPKQQKQPQELRPQQQQPQKMLPSPKEKNEDDPFGCFPDLDLAALDYSILQATQHVTEKAPPQVKETQPALQLVQSHNAIAPKQIAHQNNGMPCHSVNPAPPLAAPKEEPKEEEEEEDLFGNLPTIDFDVLDKSIAAAPTVVSTTNSANKEPTKKEEEDLFCDLPNIDFGALDQSIAAEVTSSSTQEKMIARDLMHLDKEAQRGAVPPLNAPVCNKRIPTQAIDPESLSYLSFSRYKTVRVVEDAATFTKTLSVTAWKSSNFSEPDQLGSMHRCSQRESEPVATDGVIHLRGEWFYTRVADGDIIHVCSLSGSFDTSAAALPLVLTTNLPPGSDADDDLILIMHPDLLLTPTTISETMTCTRRAILKNRLGSTGLTSKAPLFGTMRHALFEEALREQNFSASFAQTQIQRIVRSNAEGLLACNASSQEARREVIRMLPQLSHFIQEYTNFSGTNHQPSRVKGHGGPDLDFVATGVDAIEEPLISHGLGLKGNVDVIVNADVRINSPGQTSSSSLVSVELKTGHVQRAQHSHAMQLSFYNIMLQASRGAKRNARSSRNGGTESGLLLYLNSEAVSAVHVAPRLMEIKTIIGQRNSVATEQLRALRPRGVQLLYENERELANGEPRVELQYPAPPVALPDVNPSTFTCEKCYLNRECMLYAGAERSFHKTKDGVVPASHKDLLHQFTGHLTAEDFDYFQTWDRLVDLEAESGATYAAASWLIPSIEREKKTAKCISSLIFDQADVAEDALEFDENAYTTISFSRSHDSTLRTPLLNLALEHGCQVILSMDDTSITPSEGGTQPRSVRRNPQMHIFRGYMDRATEMQAFVRATRDDFRRIQKTVAKLSKQGSKAVFRLDQDNVATGVGTMRQNLVNLFTGDRKMAKEGTAQLTLPSSLSRLSRLRKMIVELCVPEYDVAFSQSMFCPATQPGRPFLALSGCDLTDLAAEYAELNEDQRAAAENVLTSKDYSLIQGLPGTGKTSTIAFVARLLAAHGKRVLITSYTHGAVDNVMLKLIDKGVARDGNQDKTPALIRVGKKSSCHPRVISILANEVAVRHEQGKSVSQNDEGAPIPSAESLKKTMDSARIVGVTALSIPRSPLLMSQHFDVVIVDEAGQISQPAIIGALMAADSFVLIGDHMQLPPLTTSEVAEQGGFGVSMLKRLAEQHPSSVAQLTLQYRMHQDICQLCNDIVYNGTLKCANEQVRLRQLDLLGFPENLYTPSQEGHAEWLTKAIDPSLPVVFLNTDEIRLGMESDDVKGVIETLERSAGRRQGQSIVNDTEANIVRVVTEGLISCGQDASNIGVICPFRAQLRRLDDCQSLQARKREGLEISTVDRYQGRDKDTIILSFVRSNSKGRVGRLLSDFRRLNVAMSRAKCKLIMVGSFSTLHTGSEALRPPLNRVKSTGRIVDLPNNFS